MADATIPVDLFNPGQVFACLGLVEAAEVILGGAAGRFIWDAAARFTLCSAGDANPLEEVLGFLSRAEITSHAPAGSVNDTGKWNVPTEFLEPGTCFPSPDPDSPATLPARLSFGETSILLDHWADATRRDNVKFWAGAGGYPGAALLRDACQQVRLLPKAAAEDPFSVSAPQSSSFRFDWRRDYIPLDAGFSPNAHGTIVMIGFPLVEILAAIGLSHARPARVEKLLYHYGVLGGDDPLPPSLLRAALTGRQSPVPGAPWRRFRMSLGWPGQEGQARCITDVQELPEEAL